MKPTSYPFPLGKYTLLKQWKSDDWGIEFLARQEGLAGVSKLAFLKTLAKPIATDPTFVALLLNEARIAARLSHPNIVQIYELGEAHGEYFIVMEYVHGHHLGTVLEAMQKKSQSFSPVLAAQLCTQVLLGLRHAHTLEDELGRPLHLVHKNVCPSNVLLGFNGAVKICNFGIPLLEAENKCTLYVAPEQRVDGKIDARVDVYAVGVLLAELLLGTFPPHCKNAEQLAKEVFQHPTLPSALADIVGCALCANRDERFESAREMALALEYHIEDAGASQVTVELANFLRLLFGDNTNNPWLSYEVEASEEGEGKATYAPAPSPVSAPSPSPAPNSPSETFSQEPLYLYFKWFVFCLWAMGFLGMLGWLLQS